MARQSAATTGGPDDTPCGPNPPGGHLPSWPLARRRHRSDGAPGLPVGGADCGPVPAVAAGSSDVEAVPATALACAAAAAADRSCPSRCSSLALARAAATSRSFIDAA